MPRSLLNKILDRTEAYERNEMRLPKAIYVTPAREVELIQDLEFLTWATYSVDGDIEIQGIPVVVTDGPEALPNQSGWRVA